MSLKGLFLALVVVAGCGKSDRDEAYAVGTTVGGESIVGPESCSYFAKSEVAKLSADARGYNFMAKLIGEGTLTKTCGATKTIYDVVEPTAGRISGPVSWKVGGTLPMERLEFVFLAGSRRLLGVDPGGTSPVWALGADCAGLASFAPVMGAQDTGGAGVSRSIIAAKPGTCTVSASLLGITATKTITIE